MPAISFVSGLLMAFGPATIFFWRTFAKSPQLVLLALTSAFCWLVSMLFASIVWYIAPSLQQTHAFTIFIAVSCQELFRFLFYLIIRRAEKGLLETASNPSSPYNLFLFATAGGFGFGLTSGLIAYIMPLAVSFGPGDIMVSSCESVSLFYLLAVQTSLFIFLQMAWMILAFDGFMRKSWALVLWTVAGHYALSYITLLTGSDLKGGCAASILVPLSYLTVSSWMCFLAVKRIKSTSPLASNPVSLATNEAIQE